LRTLGAWLRQNEEAVFGTTSGIASGGYYGPSTGTDNARYLFALGHTNGDVLRVRGLDRSVVSASVLATGQPLAFEQNGHHLAHGYLQVHLPASLIDPLATVVKLELRP
jgi:alpha-L-fucosidase